MTELEKLRTKLAQIDVRVAVDRRQRQGRMWHKTDPAGLAMLRSDCMKAIAQLTLARIESH